MTKQYIRHIYNPIILTIIIWLCVFVSGVSGTNIYITEYGYNESDDTMVYYHWNGAGAVDALIYTETHVTQYTSGKVRPIMHMQYGTVYYGAWVDGSGMYARLYRPYTNVNNKILTSSDFYNLVGSTSQHSYCIFYPSGDKYIINGSICGITEIELYIWNNNMWKLIDNNIYNIGDDIYSFDIIKSYTYKLIFSDDYEYEFICNDNIIYNYDICAYQILHYVDDCANLLKNPCINIIVNDCYANPLISNGSSHTDLFKIGDDIQLNDKLDIWIGTDQGEQYKRLYAENGENWLYHKTKSWDLNIKVYDINTSEYVSDAKVSVKQECRINGYQLYTFGITNLYGYVKTFDLSNQPYQVKVEKENYNTFGYTTINAGFDSQYTDVPLNIYIQDSTKGDGNGTIGDPPNGGEGGGGDTVLPQTECSILWTDNAGNSITEINNTQDVRLYFMASNCSTVLTLESRNISTHIWDVEDSIPLTSLQTGYVQYGVANWTYPETKRYQGRLFAYDCGCDVTDDLKVWDVNDPNTTSVNNLTANVWFRHTIGSNYVNPSSPIKITSYAASNNTSLLNISLLLFNETVKVNEISYTFFDYYVNSQFKAISWNPAYQYTAGYRYSIYMYSNDILVDFDTVFANATGDNPFDTGNTLTVKVYDHNSLPLQYSTVYVESWGSIDTGVTNEVTFTGLGDDTYEYRAIKGGYLDRGFSSVTLTADVTVSYILDIIDTEHAIRDIRMADVDIKNMLYPVIFFILIMLLIGVLIDAVN